MRLRLVIAVAPIVLAACGRVGFDGIAISGDAVDGTGPDSAGLAATSCVGLAATCGPTGTSSCCDGPIVGGGTFYRNYDVAADMANPNMSFPATVSVFRLDRFEVTVGRFRQFVNAGQGTQTMPPLAAAGAHERIANSGWDPTWNGSLAIDTAALVAAIKCDPMYQTWTDAAGGNEHRPMNCLNWYESMAFCAWDGGFLATDAEWNYAAAGGSEQRAYAWSSPAGSTVIDCTVTNYGGSTWPSTACVAAGPSDVGSVSPEGDGAWGHSDLGGNQWEWVLDVYVSPYPNPCNDCANLGPGTTGVVRGGSFSTDPAAVRVPVRGSTPRSTRAIVFGVRCARTP